MSVYIKKEIPGHFFKPNIQLTEDNCDILGTTYEDYENGKFVELNDSQIAFANENLNASIEEIFNMQINQITVEQQIKEAKLNKLDELTYYDNSQEINDFTINNEIHAWFTPTERTNYKQSIESAKLLNIDTLQFYIGDTLFNINVIQAEQMLAMIQMYADKCFIVTKQHKLAIEQLSDIESIESYDFTVGYPNKLNFEI